MHEVTVHKAEFLKTLKANREKHATDYVEAIEGYKDMLAKEFRGRLAEIESGRIPSQTLNMPKPEQHLEGYDQVIKMVEMSVDDKLTLSSSEFAQYVMDNWSWKKHFTQTMAMYAGE